MIEVLNTQLQGVLLINPDIFKDHRGEYVELYNEELYKSKGINVKFIQDDISVSAKDVLRGIHGDNETWKLISCLHGEFFFVVVNCDTDSKNYGKWQSFVLSDKNRIQVLVPPKHGNAHLVLSQTAVFHYKQSTYYDPGKQFTYKWNEPKFNINWPNNKPILSKRDESGHFV
jgi:dTDP-4-dehydrorhamnose 3,5-epimerase